MNTLLLTLLLLGIQETATLDFLSSMQSETGAFHSAPWSDGELSKDTLRTSRTGIKSFKLLGAKVPNPDKLLGFLRKCHDKESGGFSADPNSRPDPVSTSVALMILDELDQPVDQYLVKALAYMDANTKGFEQIRMVAPCLEQFKTTVPHAVDWIRELEASRNADGSFGKGLGIARSTALNEVALDRLGAKLDKERILKILNDGQRKDGGFGNDQQESSDLESCYRVVRLFYRLNSNPKRPEVLWNFIASCKNADGGYGRTPDEPSSLHGTYYSIIIRDWLRHLKYVEATELSFQDLSIGSLPSGWLATKPLLEAGSKWAVGAKEGDNNRMALGQISSDGPKRQFNLCISEHTLRDVDLQVELRAIDGKIDQGGGVVWRYQNAKNYYIMRWNPLEQNIRIYKVVDGVRSQMDTAVAKGDGAAWQKLRVVTVGRNIRGYFNDQMLLEAEDDQFLAEGRIGLWTKADAVTQFDHLKLQAASVIKSD